MSRIAPSQALASLSAALGVTNRKRTGAHTSGVEREIPQPSIEQLFGEVKTSYMKASGTLDTQPKKRAFVIQRLTILRYQNLPLNAAQFAFLSSELAAKVLESPSLTELIDAVIADLEIEKT
ncbi:hypothetical protein JF535_15080 [Microbulbifer salipaludis]|uniref:Uncharacterized protein n=1 Tax=Microbulbifer salipaludis TaxID=187980 RepID=A0ABS3EA63_9GAMM|nr:hypothetical protein [Microbulbifer salipaludis]MBN8432174.1 hypothetical protein [Microbulbifer salipaludis]